MPRRILSPKSETNNKDYQVKLDSSSIFSAMTVTVLSVALSVTCSTELSNIQSLSLSLITLCRYFNKVCHKCCFQASSHNFFISRRTFSDSILKRSNMFYWL